MEKLNHVMHLMHSVIEELQLQLKANVNLLVVLKNQMKTSMDLGLEAWESRLMLLEIVAVCQELGKIEAANKDMKLNVMNLMDDASKVFGKEIKFLIETIKVIPSIFDVLKSNMKVIEEVSPEVCHILEKVDTPASLMELGLSRVQGLANIQQGFSLEGLPVTLKTQVIGRLFVSRGSGNSTNLLCSGALISCLD